MGKLRFWWRRRNPGARNTPLRVRYSGGQGTSMEDAVVIYADSSMVGVPAEYEYIAERHGRRGIDWEMESQTLMTHGEKHFDRLHIKLADRSIVTYYFDISSFFGKF